MILDDVTHGVPGDDTVEITVGGTAAAPTESVTVDDNEIHVCESGRLVWKRSSESTITIADRGDPTTLTNSPRGHGRHTRWGVSPLELRASTARKAKHKAKHKAELESKLEASVCARCVGDRSSVAQRA
ncbi:MAG: hypothetical protein V3R77_00730 [Candidatus Binatia bacterium]